MGSQKSQTRLRDSTTINNTRKIYKNQEWLGLYLKFRNKEFEQAKVHHTSNILIWRWLDAKVQRRQWLKSGEPHSSTLAWRIPWTEEPGGLQFMGSWRVGYDWATSLSLFTFMHWSRKWQPNPVFSPGDSQGRESLVGCRLWGRTESDTTEAI